MNVDLLVANDKIKRMNAINNYFIVNSDKKKELSRLMNYSVEDVDFSKYEYAMLKRFASVHGCSGKGTLDELLPRITAYYEENKDKIKFNLEMLAVSEKTE